MDLPLSPGAGPGSTGPNTGNSSGYPRKWLTLLVVAVGTFVATLDSSMVNISLPTITQVHSSKK